MSVSTQAGDTGVDDRKGTAPGGSGGGSTFIGPSGTQRGPARWFADTGWRHVVTLVVLVFALFPVWWVIAGAFSSDGLTAAHVIPREWTLDNFRVLMSDPGHPPFWTWFKNSMVVGTVTALGSVFLCAMGAYSFSRLRWKGRRTGLLSLLLVQMFPNSLAVVALFLIMVQVKGVFPAIGLGTTWGLTLIYLGGALGVNTWLMKGFMDTIPVELDESARVDGATHAQIFFKIILPLSVPILAIVGLLAFIFTQADFLISDTIAGQNDSARTLAAGLSRYVLAGYDNRWGPFAAGALIGAIPVVILFLFLQRFLVSGLTSGAVKG
jgi:arabinogalactan oligomer / maltooligosaccharide transport system permease protein